MRRKANDGVVYVCNLSVLLITTPHCPEWYKLVLHARLNTSAVRYLVIKARACGFHFILFHFCRSVRTWAVVGYALSR